MPRADPIVQARKVQLVDPDFPNDKRRKVAEYINDHWNDNDGLTLTEIADETGTSRQHVKNTLETHFEIKETEDEGPSSDSLDDRMLEIVLQAYRMGYQDGRRDAEQEGVSSELKRLME